MRWRFEWWISRSSPSSMNSRRGWRAGSKRRVSAEFMTTWIFSGGTPRAIDSWRSGSWTVISSVEAAAAARAEPVTSGMSGRSRGWANRSRKNSGMSSCRSSSSGTPVSLMGKAEKARKSGTVATCDQRVAPPPMLTGQPHRGQPGEGEVLGHVAGKAGKARFTGRRTMRIAPLASSRCLARSAQAEQVDLVPRLHQGVRLAADTRIARVRRRARPWRSGSSPLHLVPERILLLGREVGQHLPARSRQRLHPLVALDPAPVGGRAAPPRDRASSSAPG